VSALSREWQELKTALLTGTGDTGEIPARLDAFGGSLARFFISPVGKLYQTWRPFDGALWPEPPENFSGTVDILKAALQSGDQLLVFRCLADIDAALVRLQWMDNQAADSAQSVYSDFFFLPCWSSSFSSPSFCCAGEWRTPSAGAARFHGKSCWPGKKNGPT
jgi:hypothetical protein